MVTKCTTRVGVAGGTGRIAKWGGGVTADTYLLYSVLMISSHLLREARLRAGLSQTELSRRAGKAASAISRWERGDVEPSLERLRALIRATGYDLAIGLVAADDHDVALIRRCLARAPHERLDDLVKAMRALSSMVTASRG